jgi:hypothetical protein
MAALPPEYRHEPALALGSGEDGLDATRIILRDAAEHLNPGGLLVVEIGHNRAEMEAVLKPQPVIGKAELRVGAKTVDEAAAALSRWARRGPVTARTRPRRATGRDAASGVFSTQTAVGQWLKTRNTAQGRVSCLDAQLRRRSCSLRSPS